MGTVDQGNRTVASTRQPGSPKWGIPVRKSTALALALIASAYLTAQCAEMSRHVWVGWISLTPLFFSIRHCYPLRAFVCGSLWGASLFVFSTWALEADVPVTWFSFALLILVPGIYTCLGAWCTRLAGFQPVVLGFSWMGVELAFHPLGLNRGLLAGTIGDGWLVQVVSNLLGYILVAFVVALISASLVAVLSRVQIGGDARRAYRGSPEPEWRTSVPRLTFLRLFTVYPSQPRAPPSPAI